MIEIKKKIWVLILIIGTAAVVGVIMTNYFSSQFPNTLDIGDTPVITLPMYDFSFNDYIRGYGQLAPEVYHNGIDFGVNGTTPIVAPHAAYIETIDFWFNDVGGHWQTNVHLWLNPEWSMDIIFESWALNQTYGQYQRDAIIVSVGQYVAANQTLGNLLCHGDSTHIHFGIYSNGADRCPYNYFSADAKIIFETQFALVNYTTHWCM